MINIRDRAIISSGKSPPLQPGTSPLASEIVQAFEKYLHYKNHCFLTVVILKKGFMIFAKEVASFVQKHFLTQDK